MKSASCFRLFAPALVALVVLMAGAAEARAQRSATVQVSATVTSDYSVAGWRSAAAPEPVVVTAQPVQRVAVEGLGVLEVRGMVGAQVRLAAVEETAGAGRVVRATVAYPAL